MARFENKQGISEISMDINVQCYCPLGDDWYTNKLYICLQPGTVIPDYCEVDDAIRKLAGEKLIIEDVVANVYNHIMQEYSPRSLSVNSYVEDAKHLPVTVTKQSY